MANEEQVSILRQGVKVWNKWRKENPDKEFDLRGTNLRGVNLSRADLSECDLREVNFREGKFRETNFSFSDLSNSNFNETNLSKAYLNEVNLKGAHLSASELSGTYLRGADLRGADLIRTNLREAHLNEANFSEADLSGANLSMAELSEAVFQKAYLSKADFSGAYIRGADFTESNLNGANLNRADLSESNLNNAYLSKASLRNANISDAKLRGTDLSEADLSGGFLRKSDFTGANLNLANLREGNFIGANLNGVNFMGANLIGADFSDANLVRADLSEVDLRAANLGEAYIAYTIFANVNLSQTIGIEKIRHGSPSTISTTTLQRSKGQIPESFLRGCGFSDWEVESSKLYNPNLTNEEIIKIQYHIYDLIATQAIQISPLFISYSHADKKFVDQIDSVLTKKGIRFWRDIHDMVSGRIETQIDRAITQNSTVLLILSQNSLNSDWVQHEVRKARDLEKKLGTDVLCPVALDETWKSAKWPQRIMEQIMEYNIIDFSAWEDDAKFDGMFRKLIDGLKLFYKDKSDGE